MTSRFNAVLSAVLVLGCTGTSPETKGATDDTLPASAVGVVFGQAPAAAGGIPSVVMLSPASGEDNSAPVFDADPVIDQFGLVFSPNILLIGMGQSVTFTNSESLAHNVNLRQIETDAMVLNVDTDPTESAQYTFDESGGYDVRCDVHPGMTAFVFASPTPYTVFANLDGEFTLSGVPPGSYTLTVWSTDEALNSERTVEVGEARTELDAGPVS
jgi:plastocyanin